MLDLDGVANCEDWFKAPDFSRPEVQIDGKPCRPLLEPRAVALLNQLARPGVEWVLSSSWRGSGDMEATQRARVQSMLSQLGWSGELIDSTPALRSDSTSIHTDYSRAAQPTRGDEIDAWLRSAGLRDALGTDVKLAILDDDGDLGELAPYWVPISDKHGITGPDVLAAWQQLDLIAVMVDELHKYPGTGPRCFQKGYSHMTVNGTSEAHFAELHRVGKQIGLARDWFQDHSPLADRHHYDLTKGKRRLALEAGAAFLLATDQARYRIGRRAR